MRLEPRFLSMVIPSRWMAGGSGLDEFREPMFSATGVCAALVDYRERDGCVSRAWRFEAGFATSSGIATTTGLCECRLSSRRREPSGQPCALPRRVRCLRARQRGGVDPAQGSGAEASRRIRRCLSSGDTPFGLATNFYGYARDVVPRVDRYSSMPTSGQERVRGCDALARRSTRTRT